ncbi:MAG TPA: hypothetical protein VGM29_06505 [Polyangiaceae bacterium]
MGGGADGSVRGTSSAGMTGTGDGGTDERTATAAWGGFDAGRGGMSAGFEPGRGGASAGLEPGRCEVSAGLDAERGGEGRTGSDGERALGA